MSKQKILPILFKMERFNFHAGPFFLQFVNADKNVEMNITL